MCKRLLVLLFVLGFVSSASAGLVHEWLFENNLLDTSGSGNHGTASGDPQFVERIQYWGGDPYYQFDYGGTCMYFDGDDKVEDLTANNLPVDNGSGGSPAYSINLWVTYGSPGNPSPPGSGIRAVAGWGQDVDRQGRYVTARDNNVNYYVNGDDLQGVNYYFQQWWQMITITHEGTADGGAASVAMTKIYRDGALMAQHATQQHTATVQQVCAGYLASAVDDYFVGYLDDFRIYDHVLSQQEMDDLLINIPEPATIALLGLGGLALLRRRS